MYQTPATNTDGEPIEEILPAAINATATSGKAEGQRGGRPEPSSRSRELARRERPEPAMRVMRAGSLTGPRPALNVAGLPGGLVVIAAVTVVLALIVLAVVLI